MVLVNFSINKIHLRNDCLIDFQYTQLVDTEFALSNSRSDESVHRKNCILDITFSITRSIVTCHLIRFLEITGHCNYFIILYIFVNCKFLI